MTDKDGNIIAEAIVINELIPDGYIYGIEDPLTGKGYIMVNSRYHEGEIFVSPTTLLPILEDQELSGRLLSVFMNGIAKHEASSEERVLCDGGMEGEPGAGDLSG